MYWTALIADDYPTSICYVGIVGAGAGSSFSSYLNSSVNSGRFSSVAIVLYRVYIDFFDSNKIGFGKQSNDLKTLPFSPLSLIFGTKRGRVAFNYYKLKHECGLNKLSGLSQKCSPPCWSRWISMSNI